MTRVHSKARFGCSQCKTRRVKCDEAKPSCGNCTRRKAVCSLKFLMPDLPMRRTTIIQSNNEQIAELEPDASSSPTNEIQCQQLEFGPLSSELLHIYRTTTCFSLGRGKVFENMANEILQISVEYPFLMHGILAVSALQLAQLQPNRNVFLKQTALQQEQLALPSFRKLLSEDNNSRACHAVFAFSGLVVPYVSALTANEHQLPISSNQPHRFHSLRGLTNLLDKNWSVLSNGPFRPLLVKTRPPIDFNRNPDDPYLSRLHKLLVLIPDEAERIACQEALDELRRISALPLTPNSKVVSATAVLIWPGVISDNFLSLLYLKRPEALAIMAGYCVLLKEANHIWYWKGMGAKVLREIWEALDEQWRKWIIWALIKGPALN